MRKLSVTDDEKVIFTELSEFLRKQGGFENCCDIGKCPRVEKDMHQGEGADDYIILPAKELQWVLDK